MWKWPFFSAINHTFFWRTPRPSTGHFLHHLQGRIRGTSVPIYLIRLPKRCGTWRRSSPTSCEEEHMAEARRISRVHRSLSRPLTIVGSERKLFFFAMCLGAATFNLLNSLIGGLLMFLLLYFMARWATQTDPQILRFLLTAGRLRTKYDPMKFTPIEI